MRLQVVVEWEQRDFGVVKNEKVRWVVLALALEQLVTAFNLQCATFILLDFNKL